MSIAFHNHTDITGRLNRFARYQSQIEIDEEFESEDNRRKISGDLITSENGSQLDNSPTDIRKLSDEDSSRFFKNSCPRRGTIISIADSAAKWEDSNSDRRSVDDSENEDYHLEICHDEDTQSNNDESLEILQRATTSKADVTFTKVEQSEGILGLIFPAIFEDCDIC